MVLARDGRDGIGPYLVATHDIPSDRLRGKANDGWSASTLRVDRRETGGRSNASRRVRHPGGGHGRGESPRGIR